MDIIGDCIFCNKDNETIDIFSFIMILPLIFGQLLIITILLQPIQETILLSG